jgi:hypothetical protein
MPVVQPPPTSEADEDTLSGLEGVPTVQTMVVPPETVQTMVVPPDQVQALTGTDGPAPRPVPAEAPKEHFSVRAARLIVALAVVAALALLVYWLLGQSR